MGSRNHLNLTLRSVETEKALSVTSSPADMDGKPASPPNNKTSNSATSSPRTSRKRTNDEVYRPSQAAHSSPPRLSDGLKRPNTAPEQSIQRMPARQSMFATHGFSAFDSSNSATSTLKPESSRGSITTAVKKPNAFQVSIKEYQDNLDKECRLFERKLNERDGNAELEDIDWDELEGRCHAAMDPKITAEQDVMRECSALFQVCQMVSLQSFV